MNLSSSASRRVAPRASFAILRRRYRPHFRLRTVLIVMTLASLVMGGVVHRVRRQSQAVSWIMSHGGSVAYQFRYGDNAMRQVRWHYGDAREFSWLSRLVGPDLYLDVVGVQLHAEQVDDISLLKRLTRLEYLDLNRTRTRDLEPLRNHTRLTSLLLKDTSVANIEPLVRLRDLRTLQLSGTAVRDLAPLAKMPHLRSLDLCFTPVEDIRPLAGHQELGRLSLGGPVRDLLPLADLPALEQLHLGGPLVEDLHILGRPPNLRHVLLSDSVLHAGTSFADLRRLESLTLLRMSVEDTMPLRRLERLAFLILRDTTVRKEDFLAFQRDMPDCWILPRRLVEEAGDEKSTQLR